ncbi:MAG: NAD-glutamate dehydrogenase [Parvularculaceae bacterium]
MADGFQSDADEEVLKQVLNLATKEKIGDFEDDGQPTAAFANYVGQLVRFATGEDRLWSEPRGLLERAAQAWRVGAVRKANEHVVHLRVENETDWRAARLVLDITTDDRPFLVDSISAALAEAGKPVSFFANAVVDCVRDAKDRRTAADGMAIRESMIHAEMDPPVDDQEIPQLEEELQRVLADVTVAVADWEPMRARLGSCIAQLERARPAGVDREEQREAVEFLKWLWDNRFAFLGVRHYRYAKEGDKVVFEQDPEGDLGILKDPDRRILKNTYSEAGDLSPAVEAFLESGEPILTAKANAKSFVHRRVYMDYVGVKAYSVDGKVIGEDRFIGLYTSEAYHRPARDIPLLRAKVRKVVEGASFLPGGHNEKALINILETYPRDEVFQIDVESLRETCLGILRLYKRPRVKLFLRRDRFDRFISALVYVPRDRFNSDIREAIGALLTSTFNGRLAAFHPSFRDAALVRVHFIIGIDPGAPEGPGITELTRAIRRICRSWSDDLLDEMRAANEGLTPRGLFAKYEKAFDASYREHTAAAEALEDIAAFESLREDEHYTLRAYRKANDAQNVVRIKIYRRGGPLRLTNLIPTIENMGLCVSQEAGYEIRIAPAESEPAELCWIHDFYTEEHLGRDIDIDAVKRHFEEALCAIFDGRCEDDGFNALVLAAGLSYREAWMLRAVARHHLQSGFSFSQAYIEEALIKHPTIARDLIGVFHARFNPSGPKKPDARRREVESAEENVLQALDNVESLDEDRIIRRFLNVFAAMTRANYYQRGEAGGCKPYISFKLDSARIDELPKPKPYREIFVSGPRVDGVHLRFGPVARGGLRWSDRREDYRTEVLGLVKAQRVKNAVIVPTGAKGGFYPKQLPAGGDRNAIYEEGREAYKLFIRGLLDLTDNIVSGKVAPPPDLVSWDDADPYLVVAADKGTAQFSDTANAISEEYGFWLGDAFASGGSAGYDHKEMGITARGAWEAVKRHFRELGKDIQKEAFTVAGVGDMSGDVFGNGMLLSKKIKLVAAFDHRDIFIDPDPDPAKSFDERKRLFDTPRSTWQEYDAALISKGGGVFSRKAKSIAVTPEMKALLDIEDDKLTPAELIRAILKAPVELFWLGGIGTYFKAENEENWRVGDRANDAVRVDAEEIRAQVVGEGANLGMTQRARIAFARKGGRINTDAIDNSAGVDTSDHEVNIKILLSTAIEHGELNREDRDALLSAMTEDVAEHVLRHNYDQTRAITQMESTASQDIDSHLRFMAALERDGRLDRKLEFLPDAEVLTMLKSQGLGLTRPEIAVLLAYSKLWLLDELVASGAPDDPFFEQELFNYFPKELHGFTGAIVNHRLRREIISTRLANEIAEVCSLGFVQRVTEAAGARVSEAALAYEAARRIYNLGDFAAAVDALDNKAPAELQTALYIETSNLLREQLYRIISDRRSSELLASRGLKGVIEHYRAPVAAIKKSFLKFAPPEAAAAYDARVAQWRERGATDRIAKKAALLPALERALDIVDLSVDTGWSNWAAGAVFFSVGRLFGIDPVRNEARRTPPKDHFDKLAARRLIEELAIRQRQLSMRLIAFADKEPEGAPASWIQDLIEEWRAAGDETITRAERFIAELELKGAPSVGQLSLFSRKLEELCEWLAEG